MSWKRMKLMRSGHAGETRMKTGGSSTKRSGPGTRNSRGNRLRASEAEETRCWQSSWPERGCHAGGAEAEAKAEKEKEGCVRARGRELYSCGMFFSLFSLVLLGRFFQSVSSVLA